MTAFAFYNGVADVYVSVFKVYVFPTETTHLRAAQTIYHAQYDDCVHGFTLFLCGAQSLFCKSVTYEFFGLLRHLNEPGGITGYDAAAFSILQSSVYCDKMLFETFDLQITSEIVYVAL